MHISYSELKTWAECPFKRKLIYLDRVRKFIGNEFTAFGRAIHAVCEHAVENRLPEDDYEDYFEMQFLKELKDLKGTIEFRKNLVEDMRSQGKAMLPHIMPILAQNFEDYEVFSVEEQLYESIPAFETKPYNFKGFIDLVIKTPDGKYHIIDWKTCSWGWDSKKRSDKMITYQLTLYKKFWCAKHNIEPSLVETHFALLKRTAKKNNVEIFRVTSGPKKTSNATKLLIDALTHTENGNHVKDRRSCDKCEFNNTKHCPR